MIIPLFVDETKDKELIDWLKTKTNRSATIREILYAYKRGIGITPFIQEYKNKEVKNEDLEEVDKSFMDSLKVF